MAYHFSCPACKTVLTLPVHVPGALFICNRCGTAMQLPGAAPPVAEPVSMPVSATGAHPFPAPPFPGVSEPPPLPDGKADNRLDLNDLKIEPQSSRRMAARKPLVNPLVNSALLAAIGGVLIYLYLHRDPGSPEVKKTPEIAPVASPRAPRALLTGDEVEIVQGDGNSIGVIYRGGRIFIENRAPAVVIDGIPRRLIDDDKVYFVKIIGGLHRGKEVLAPAEAVHLKATEVKIASVLRDESVEPRAPEPKPKAMPAVETPSPPLLSESDWDRINFWLVIGGTIFGYFLPTFIAFMRRHHNAGAILVLNLVLGWTVLGWLVALIWSCSAILSNQHVHYHHEGNRRAG